MDRYKYHLDGIDNNALPKLRRTYFKTNKEKGYPYFFGSKVGSCSYVKVKNGQCLAVPFFIINRRGRYLNHFKTVPDKLYSSKSTYKIDFIPRPDMHCGMKKKPLIPYSMNSSRSQLPINTFLSGAAANRSFLELGDSKIINRKQWTTTYRDFYRKPNFIPVSNMGIAANMAKASHAKLSAF